MVKANISELVTLTIAEGVKLVKNVLIPMRDGVRLAADLYMPANTGAVDRWPVVMEYIPYRKDDVHLARRPFYLTFPRHGYVVARVDVRGTGASEGVSTDEYTLQEQLDGYDAVEWLAQQPWCDGHVNMMGISYGGFTALQVASHNPPHLTSIIPVDFTDDRYTDDCHFRGGLLRKYFDIAYYGGQMVTRNAIPPYPEWSGDEWAEVWEHHLTHNEPYLLQWYRHQTDGEYWRNGSVRDEPEAIRCPAFLIGGWRDGYPNPPLRLFRYLQVPRKVLIGPWNHALPDVAIPGPRIDYLREVLRWLDYWCRGEDTGIMDEPTVAVYVQRYQPPDPDRLDTPGAWRAEREWPPPGAGVQVYYLGDDNLLMQDPPLGDAPLSMDTFEYNPTIGLTAGLWSGGIPFGQSGDQRPDEAFSLVYTTRPLTNDLHILGWPRAVLHASSSATVMGFAVSLSEVAADGTSHLVAKGMLNATRRGSFSEPAPLTPGEVYELDIQIDCTGWVFTQGNRIRLSIASADWPNVWPTPESASNRVVRGPQHPSRLILPIVPAEGSATPPTFHPSPRAVARHTEATQPPVWQVTRDQFTGRTTVHLAHRAGWRVDDTTVVEQESSSAFDVAPSRPSDASARGCHYYRIIHPNQVTQARADLSVQATATHFHLTIEVEVRVNGALHFTKHWVDSVPRHFL
jgi:putative CocE/NonD family hydrolase